MANQFDQTQEYSWGAPQQEHSWGTPQPPPDKKWDRENQSYPQKPQPWETPHKEEEKPVKPWYQAPQTWLLALTTALAAALGTFLWAGDILNTQDNALERIDLTQIEELGAAGEELAAQVTDLQNKLTESETKVGELQAQLDQATSSDSSLQQALDSANQQIQELTGEINSAHQLVADKDATLSQAQSQLDQWQQVAKSLTQILENAGIPSIPLPSGQ